MFSTGGMVLDDFLFLIKNRDKLICEMGKRGRWRDAKTTKQNYSWRNWNNEHGIRTEKTFSIEYGFEGTDRTIEILYRHYPFTVENFFKVRKRVRRTAKDTRTPFYIFHVGDGQEPDYDKMLREFLALPYEWKLAFVPSTYDIEESKYLIKTDLVHEELMPVVDEHLRKHFPQIEF